MAAAPALKRTTLVASSLALSLLVVAPLADARVVSYPNCKAMNAVYRHGVGKRGAVDRTSGRPVTNFLRNNAIYNANRSRDRDHDGIACEKR
jgi:hypothetical protein